MVILFDPVVSASSLRRAAVRSNHLVARFIVANLAALWHKRGVIARLIKGCRVDVRAGCLISEIAEHFQRSNEHFSRENRLRARFCCGHRRAKCPS